MLVILLGTSSGCCGETPSSAEATLPVNRICAVFSLHKNGQKGSFRIINNSDTAVAIDRYPFGFYVRVEDKDGSEVSLNAADDKVPAPMDWDWIQLRPHEEVILPLSIRFRSPYRKEVYPGDKVTLIVSPSGMPPSFLDPTVKAVQFPLLVPLGSLIVVESLAERRRVARVK